MTYKKNIPKNVYDRWKKINPSYNIEFSLDNDCEIFLEKNFNLYILNKFKSIKKGMYKADLWRLCKLYIDGGVYADVDLVPYLNIDTLNKNISFYSCLARDKKSIFQAFMVNLFEKNSPLILCFLISFLQNNPYNYNNGPTIDMYNCIKYNLIHNIYPNIKYKIEEIKIPITIGPSEKNIKNIDLYFFPNDLKNYKIKLKKNKYDDKFNFEINNNILKVKRLDYDSGWGHNHKCDICIPYNKNILLFEEKGRPAYVTYNNKKILLSRDPEYAKNKGW
jgi:hypothetical protein